MTFSDAYQEALLKLKLVLPDNSYIDLEDVLRGMYVAGLEEAAETCEVCMCDCCFDDDEKEAAHFAADSIRALIEQVQGNRNG